MSCFREFELTQVGIAAWLLIIWVILGKLLSVFQFSHTGGVIALRLCIVAFLSYSLLTNHVVKIFI